MNYEEIIEIFERFKIFVNAVSDWFESRVIENIVILLKFIGALFIDILMFSVNFILSLVS